MPWSSRRPDRPVTEDPRSFLLKALGSRDYSRAQLERKLRERGHAPDRIEAAIQELVQAGLFREDSFASARIRAFLSKGRGPTWIKAKLRAERVEVTDAQIDEAYDHLGLSAQEQVRDLVRKALSTTRMRRRFEEDARAARSHLIHSIVAKGHAVPLVMRIVDEIRNQSSEA